MNTDKKMYFVVCDVCGLFSKRDLKRWILLYFPMDGKRIKIYYKGIQYFPMDGKRIKIYYKGIQKLFSKVKTVKEQFFSE
jgi:hypothetical protein